MKLGRPFIALLLVLVKTSSGFLSMYKSPRALNSFTRVAADEPSKDLWSDENVALPAHVAQEMNNLKYQISLIEALEERNKAQLDSFVDEQDQWESLEEHERKLLSSKRRLEDRMEELVSELVNDWIGRKSLDG